MIKQRPTTFQIILFLYSVLLGGFFALWQMQIIKRGYAVQDLGILVSLQTIVSLVLDIPAGAWADRIGPGKVTTLGFALFCLSYLFPIYSESSFALAIAILIISVGDTLINGALDSWINEATTSHPEELKKSYISREYWNGFGRITGAVLIPVIATLTGEPIKLVWAPFFILAVTLFVVSAMKQRRLHALRPQKKDVHLLSTYQAMKNSLSEAISDPLLLILLVSSFVFGISDGGPFVYFRPKLIEFGFESSLAFGLIQASLTMSRLFGLRFFSHLGLSHSKSALPITLIFAGAFGTLFAISRAPYLGLSMWWIRLAILALYFPLFKTAITQSKVGLKNTATILSLNAVIYGMGTLVSTSMSALIPALQNNTVGLAISGVMCAASGLVLFKAVPKTN